VDVLRRGAAATAEDVREPRLRELPEIPPRGVGKLVVAAERVRKSCVRVACGVHGRDAAQGLEVRAHLRGAERAVDADRERLRVLDGDPERLRRLTRERPAAPVGDRDGEHQRHLRRDLLRRGDRRLRVEGVEDRLDQQEIRPAVDQASDLLRVALGQLVERDRAERRVAHPRGERERLVRRPDGARHESILAAGDRALRDLRSRAVDLVHERAELVVRLGDRGRRERVRGDDVRAGVEVAAVNLLHRVGSREVQDVDVSAEVAPVLAEALAAELLLGELEGLDRGAHRSVEHEDAFGEELLQSIADAWGGSHLSSVRARTLPDHESHRLPLSDSPAVRSVPPKASCAAGASRPDIAREEQTAPGARSGPPAGRGVSNVTDRRARQIGARMLFAATLLLGYGMRMPFADASGHHHHTFMCDGQRATIVGTHGDDRIKGTPHHDVIVSLGGNDVVKAGGGADLVCAGAGKDVVLGGAGADTELGGDGNDQLDGGDGGDDLQGEDGNDQLDGGTGSDDEQGGSGDDLENGDQNDDTLSGDAGDDDLNGGSGDDQLDGGDDNDSLDGGKGDDYEEGGQGGDDCQGDEGNDDINGGGGDDQLDGGQGNDDEQGDGGDDAYQCDEGDDCGSGDPQD
jgi:hypothetical protein